MVHPYTAPNDTAGRNQGFGSTSRCDAYMGLGGRELPQIQGRQNVRSFSFNSTGLEVQTTKCRRKIGPLQESACACMTQINTLYAGAARCWVGSVSVPDG